MPTASGSPTQISTSVASKAALAAQSASQFEPGDLAYDAGGDQFFKLVNDPAVANGTTLLYTKESNPANGGSGTLRWRLTNIVSVITPPTPPLVEGYVELTANATSPVSPAPASSLLSVLVPPSVGANAFEIQFGAAGTVNPGASNQTNFDLLIDNALVATNPGTGTAAGQTGGPASASYVRRFTPPPGFIFASPHTFSIRWQSAAGNNALIINPTLSGNYATLRVTPRQ